MVWYDKMVLTGTRRASRGGGGGGNSRAEKMKWLAVVSFPFMSLFSPPSPSKTPRQPHLSEREREREDGIPTTTTSNRQTPPPPLPAAAE